MGEANRKLLNESMAKRNIIGLQHSNNIYSAVELEWFAVLIRCCTGRKMTAARAISYLFASWDKCDAGCIVLPSGKNSSLTELGSDYCNVFLQRVCDPEIYPKLMTFSENAKHWQLFFKTFRELLLICWTRQRADITLLILLFLNLALLLVKEWGVQLCRFCLEEEAGSARDQSNRTRV